MILAPADLRKRANEIAMDGVAFAQNVLGHKTWPTQDRIIRSLLTNPLTVVAGCHNSSKTFSAAQAAIYCLTRYDDAVVVVTAPKEAQAKEGVWKEMKIALASARLRYDTSPGELSWKLSDKNYAVIRVAAKGGRGVRYHGIKANHLTILVDEAPGVDAEIYEAIEGLRAGGIVHVGLFGNPTVPGGYFYDCFTRDRERWTTIMIDGMDTPNLQGVTLEEIARMPLDPGSPLDDNPWPFLITRRYVREMYDLWGEFNPRFEARVRGRFPQHDEDALIPLVLLEAARNRDTVSSGRRLSAGIDVAGGGKAENVLYVVDRGHIVTHYPIAVSTAGVDQATGEMVAALEGYRRDLGVVWYDDIGEGSRLGSILRNLGFDAVGVNVGSSPQDKERFPKLRDELFWELREMFRRGEVAGLEDETTIAQLSAIRYEYQPDGRIKIEGKKSLASRGVKSPDRADALMLAMVSSVGGVEEISVMPTEAIHSRMKWKP